MTRLLWRLRRRWHCRRLRGSSLRQGGQLTFKRRMAVKDVGTVTAPDQAVVHAQLLKRNHKIALALWATRDKTHWSGLRSRQQSSGQLAGG